MHRPSKRPARPNLKALAANLTEEQVEEGAAADQPFTPLDTFDRREVSLKERLATAEARATEAEEARAAAEAALEAARIGGGEEASTEAATAFERTQEALRAAEAELARYRDIAEKAEAEASPAEFRYIDPAKIEDSLPADRFDVAYSEEEIADLVADIRDRR